MLFNNISAISKGFLDSKLSFRFSDFWKILLITRLCAEGEARTFVVDLTGLFPTNDYALRISNFWNVSFDYIGIDTSSQKDVNIQKVDPIANLHQAFATNSPSS